MHNVGFGDSVFLGERLNTPTGSVGALGAFDFKAALTDAAQKTGQKAQSAADARTRNAPVQRIGKWRLKRLTASSSVWEHPPNADSAPAKMTDTVTALAYAATHPSASAQFEKDFNAIRAARVRCAKTGDCPESSTGLFSAAGKSAEFVYDRASRAIEAADAAIESIPVLGDVHRLVGEAYTAPLRLAESIASGTRIDRAFVKSFKDQVRILKEAAPYAQAVVSFVPGIGTGVSAALGAGIALADGRGIDGAIKSAARSALPGGPAAVAAFDTALDVAKGADVGEAALKRARELVPEGPARAAFDVGLAVATGEKIQDAVAQGIARLGADQLQGIAQDWAQKAAQIPQLQEALNALPEDIKPGYELAMGALKLEGMSAKALSELRRKLSDKMREGFDLALDKQQGKRPWVSDALPPRKRRVPSVKAKTAKLPTVKTKTQKLPSVRTTKALTPLEQLAALSPAERAQLNALADLSKLSPEEREALAGLSPDERARLASLSPKERKELAKSAAARKKGSPLPPPAAAPAVARSARPYPPYPRMRA